MQTPYVLFGTHPLFGDYVDTIHSAGGILKRLIRNVEEPERPVGQRVEDRLANYHRWLRSRGIDHEVEVVWLENYRVRLDEIPVAGFRGPKLEPLISVLKERFGLFFPPLIDKHALVSPMTELAEGVYVGPGAIVGPNVKIGRFSYINRGATIGHDGVIDEHVIIGPSAALASSVHLRRGAIIGIKATVLENLTIGDGSYVAGGAVVVKEVAPQRMVAGVPAVDKKAFLRF